MDGMEAILQAEKEAERIRLEAREAAQVLLTDAEAYRQIILDEVRRQAEKEQLRLLEQAERRAQERRAELLVIADVREAELRSAVEARLDKTAAWIADQISEI